MAVVLGEIDIADALQSSLEEEEEMADWIDNTMDQTVRTFMERASAAVA